MSFFILIWQFLITFIGLKIIKYELDIRESSTIFHREQVPFSSPKNNECITKILYHMIRRNLFGRKRAKLAVCEIEIQIFLLSL